MSDKKINEFYSKQKDQTAVKIFFYNKYLEEYLIRILMTFGQCILMDLFCGQGKNGDESGSPLILLENLNKVLDNPILKKVKPDANVIVVFNDCDPENVNALKNQVAKIKVNKKIQIVYTNDDYKGIIKKIVSNSLFKTNVPKFFFLDPFTYSLVEIQELRDLLNLNNAEILLFLPAFHAYRFVNKSNIEEKLKKFLIAYTEKGIVAYKDIKDFIFSIRNKLTSELKPCYVRPLLIDGKSTKNSLFLITRNISGLIILNDIVWKNSGNILGGSFSSIRKHQLKAKQASIFKKTEFETSEVSVIKKNLLRMLKEKSLDNTEIIYFVSVNLYRLPDANTAVKNLIKEGLVEVECLRSDCKKGALYISYHNRDTKKTRFILKK